MTDPEERDPLDVLLEQFTSAVRRGESPDVEPWAERHPEYAEQIRELFPTVVAIEGLRDETSRSGSGARIGIGVIERLGDYRIVSEIGRGGMGVVYEAEQESLGRHVAVKVLPPLRDPKRIRRFEREARTAARLHHTNIVPIFGVGEQDGFHYYVMQVIRGVGLDVVLRALRHQEWHRDDRGARAGLTPEEAVRMLRTGEFQGSGRSPATELSSSGAVSVDESAPVAETELPVRPDPGPPTHVRAPYWHSVAEIGRQVADALAYAHAQNVLHRDVKPGNLLLDAHGVIWVTDFGLAKAIEQDELTGSGDLVGTLQYMAPEQLHGRYDARTDVYGLGLTLYELLTLQPAFVDGDRGGLIKKIEQGDPTPPSHIRPGIPHDLETIVLKAIQHDPRHRYQTAAELAEDLQRFLEDRPILARRATAFEQTWRWCRRNRAVASLAAVAILAVVGAAVAGWTGYVSTRAALRQAQEQQELANANLETALEAFDDMFQWIAGGDRIEIVVDQTGDEASYEWYAPSSVSEEDTALLEKMLAFYDRFAEQNADSAELRLESAQAHRRVGDLLLQLRRLDDAERAYQSALDSFQKLDAGTGSQRVLIAGVKNDLGRVRMEARGAQDVRGEFEGVLAMLEGDDSRGARFERARAHEHLGLAAFSRRRFDRNGRRGGRSRPSDEGRPPPDAPPPDDGSPKAPPPDQQDDPRREGNPRLRMLLDSLDHFRTAYDLMRALVEEETDNPAFQVGAARIGQHLLRFGLPSRTVPGGWVEQRVDRAAVAHDCVSRLEQVAARHPDVTIYQHELARTCLAVVPRGRGMDPGRPPDEPAELDARPYVERAREIADHLVAEHPEDVDAKRLLADALEASARLTADDPAAAEATLRRAIETRTSLDSPFDAWRALEHRYDLIRLLARSDRLPDAIAEVKALLTTLEANVQPNQERSFMARYWRSRMEGFARFLEDRGREAEAQELRQRARDVLGR